MQILLISSAFAKETSKFKRQLHDFFNEPTESTLPLGENSNEILRDHKINKSVDEVIDKKNILKEEIDSLRSKTSAVTELRRSIVPQNKGLNAIEEIINSLEKISTIHDETFQKFGIEPPEIGFKISYKKLGINDAQMRIGEMLDGDSLFRQAISQAFLASTNIGANTKVTNKDIRDFKSEGISTFKGVAEELEGEKIMRIRDKTFNSFTKFAEAAEKNLDTLSKAINEVGQEMKSETIFAKT